MFSTSYYFFSQNAVPCDLGTPPGINVALTNEMTPSAQRLGFYLVNIGGSLITASLAIFVEDISLIYIASNGDIEVVYLISRYN